MYINIKALESEGIVAHPRMDERDKLIGIDIQPQRWDSDTPRMLRERLGLTYAQVDELAGTIVEMQVFNAIRRTQDNER